MAKQETVARQQNKAGQIVVSEKVRDWIKDDHVRKAIHHALAGWMNVDEFLSQVMVALQKKGSADRNGDYQPGPADCTPQSKFEAMHQCAVLQLLPTLSQVAFIPRKCKGVWECTVMPMWPGYKALMERHPDVLEVDAEIVFADDVHHYDATTRQFDHEYDPFDGDRNVDEELSNIKGGYLRIAYRDGRPLKFHFVTHHTIFKARSCARTLKIWKPFAREMTLKTIFRNAYARRVIPIDPLVIRHMNQLIENEDQIHQNDPAKAIRKSAPSKPIADLTSQITGAPRIEQVGEAVDYSREIAESEEVAETVTIDVPDDTIIEG